MLSWRSRYASCERSLGTRLAERGQKEARGFFFWRQRLTLVHSQYTIEATPRSNVVQLQVESSQSVMALIATTPVRLGKRVWRPWLGEFDHRCDDDEREATKRAKTTLDELASCGSSYAESLFFNRGDCQGTQVLIVSQRKLHDCPPAGPTSLARLTVDENDQYSLQVLLHTIESDKVESVD